MKRLTSRLGNVPPECIGILGRSIGQLAFWLDIRHRRIVDQNIAFVFPSMQPDQRRDLGRRVFQHYGTMALDTVQATFMTPEHLLQRVRIENLDFLLATMDHPHGCIVYSAHLGNWELGLMAFSVKSNRSLTTVAKPIKWQAAHTWLMALRSRFGNRVVFKDGAMPFLIESLRKGQSVAVLIDQGVRSREAVEVSFFGKRTMATPAAALLGLRCRVPVIPIFCVRDDGGHYCLRVQPPVTFERGAPLRDDIAAYTQKLFHVLEDAIKANPEQWFWFHKRWKRTHPQLYPQYQERRRKKRLKKGLNV